jgi:hypothetical protein
MGIFIKTDYVTQGKRLTVCVTCVWAGVDSAWEQKKPEARKMLENAAESHTSGARFVGTLYDCRIFIFISTFLNLFNDSFI